LKWPPLCSGHNQRKNDFKFRVTGKSADFPVTHFHGRSHRGKRHLQHRFLRKRGAAGVRLLPLGGAVAQRLRGFESAEPEKTVKRSSRRTGVNLQFFPVQPTPLGLKGASSPFFVAPARRNRWWFSGSLLPPKENIPRQAEPSPRSAFKIVPLPEINRLPPALRRCCFAPAAPAP